MFHKFTLLLLIIASLLVAPVSISAQGGFDQYGYNNQARLFNGTGMSWCMGKVGNAAWCEAYLGSSANDRLVMKWTADWDRGNQENWNNPPYSKAWTNNQWNGMVPGGSGTVWHYKISWIGPCGADGTALSNGGYCIWGQFEVLMDQGSTRGAGHEWFAHASPGGYGAR